MTFPIVRMQADADTATNKIMPLPMDGDFQFLRKTEIAAIKAFDKAGYVSMGSAELLRFHDVATKPWQTGTFKVLADLGLLEREVFAVGSAINQATYTPNRNKMQKIIELLKPHDFYGCILQQERTIVKILDGFIDNGGTRMRIDILNEYGHCHATHVKRSIERGACGHYVIPFINKKKVGWQVTDKGYVLVRKWEQVTELITGVEDEPDQQATTYEASIYSYPNLQSLWG